MGYGPGSGCMRKTTADKVRDAESERFMALLSNAQVLPHGWFEATDESDRTYYYNENTQETSWNFPTLDESEFHKQRDAKLAELKAQISQIDECLRAHARMRGCNCPRGQVNPDCKNPDCKGLGNRRRLLTGRDPSALLRAIKLLEDIERTKDA